MLKKGLMSLVLIFGLLALGPAMSGFCPMRFFQADACCATMPDNCCDTPDQQDACPSLQSAALMPEAVTPHKKIDVQLSVVVSPVAHDGLLIMSYGAVSSQGPPLHLPGTRYIRPPLRAPPVSLLA
jgi:hypothetical protein